MVTRSRTVCFRERGETKKKKTERKKDRETKGGGIGEFHFHKTK